MWLNKDEMRERRNKIIEVAYRLFCEHGIEKISMEEIAKQANAIPLLQKQNGLNG